MSAEFNKVFSHGNNIPRGKIDWNKFFFSMGPTWLQN